MRGERTHGDRASAPTWAACLRTCIRTSSIAPLRSRSSPELRRAVTNRGRRHRISAIASIREEFSKARVIVVTTFEGDEAIQRALTLALAH
jgi:DNA-binding NarL/FixJ family response regulator